ncbi:hypothetical protein ACIQF8_17155 [Pseudarthrobacter sp. NPDC092184]|uniref:hypothetical protein n=1 Tax=unclassified Pseudarthrobacter TaxID=2647000 RepID=UPI0037F80368
MIEALHLGSLILAAAGAFCAAAAKGPDKASGVVIALLMLAAMADSMMHIMNVPAPGWAVILLLTALVAGFLGRHVPNAPHKEGLNGMVLHRNIGLIMAAPLLITMDAHTGAEIDANHTGHGTTGLLSLVLGGGSLLYLAASVWMVMRRRHGSVVERLEPACMGLSLVAMGGVWLP